jgi:guanyl-specific ribonuclease Sa
VVGAVKHANNTLRHGLKIAEACLGRPDCMIMTTGIELGQAVAASRSSSWNPLKLPGQFCPGGDCNETVGALTVDLAIGAASSAAAAGGSQHLFGFSMDELFTEWLATTNSRAPISWITPGSLPAVEEAAVLRTLEHIDAGTVPSGLSRRWGVRFNNRDGDLPGARSQASPYREYRVAPPPGTRLPGPMRVVVDSATRAIYYTWTHYGDGGFPAFVRIR